jgi:hypothetical protein
MALGAKCRSTELIVLSDNSTRWNSTYYMIKRALKLRDQINVFSNKHRKELEKDLLMDEEWDQLEAIHNILRPFKRVTKRLEGRAEKGECGSLWEGLPALETLLSHVELVKMEYASHKQLAISLNEAWTKLRQYYEKMDESSAYAAALMLHPRHKLHYFTKRWKTHLAQYIQPTKDALRKQYEEEYLIKYPVASVALSSQKKKGTDPLQDFLDEDSDNDSDKGQYEAYNESKQEILDPDENLFKWWAGQLPKLPALVHWAWDMLSIPAMSSECERSFSGAKLTIIPIRNALETDIVEAIEVLNRWQKIEKQDRRRSEAEALQRQRGLVINSEVYNYPFNGG